ncbi:DUF6114 domain-containing protein [Streptomyces sp. Ru71]|uniref:DUF6114 domain-containing protein n=1 Tax=Streptomyces sp. Ru71 TaxID=2080746 RepID=UPI001C725E22|nr:DUF6114 domain-containing protein [Streptomyces sp. Ru71]
MFLSRRKWRAWRRSRPFWGGLATVLAGGEICVLPLAPLEVMLKQGVAGLPSVLLGLVMIVLGLSAWVAPHYRGLAGTLTVLLAVAALVMSNLGGFLLGTLLGIVGGSMIFAWQPVRPEPATEPATEPAADEPGGPTARTAAPAPATAEPPETAADTPGTPPPTGTTAHRTAPTVRIPSADTYGKGLTP